jgi:NadR type nicotinamide-nucleotide adenylyltransferase
VLGKFMPAHRGHVYLVDFARRFAKRLTVLVCSIRREPLDGALRYEWMRELFHGGNVEVIHVTDEVPQTPDEHPAFWPIWKELVQRHVAEPVDAVFTSETYGETLAQTLDARHYPVDPGRQVMPISGSRVRDDPLTYWDMLPEVVRPHYVKRICVFGPESTGKSTLTQNLATHYRTSYAPEYARTLLDPKQGRCDAEDVAAIVHGQIASEEAAARHADRVVFCDTDPLTTTLWCEVMFGHCPEWIYDAADRRRYDLTLLLDIDVPWIDDEQRCLPHRREEFMQRCVAALERHGRPFELIRGTWAQRFARATSFVDQLHGSLRVNRTTS